MKQVVFEYVDMFKSMDDMYLSERSADILDIGRRVLGNLVGVNEDSDQAFPETPLSLHRIFRRWICWQYDSRI